MAYTAVLCMSVLSASNWHLLISQDTSAWSLQFLQAISERQPTAWPPMTFRAAYDCLSVPLPCCHEPLHHSMHNAHALRAQDTQQWLAAILQRIASVKLPIRSSGSVILYTCSHDQLIMACTSAHAQSIAHMKHCVF